MHVHAPLRITIHPIHRIPLEILAAILVTASEEDFMLPVVASHVCRAWRSVALHTPRLWRTVDLDHREQMWAERVRRSKSCTLDIRVRSPQYQVLRRAYWPSPTTEAELIQHKMFFATAYLNRWRSLDITISRHAPYLWTAALSDCCSAWARTRPGALEELTLVYPQNDDATEFLLFGGYAPSLRRVTLEGIHVNWLPSLYHNLTSLNYTHHGFTSGIDAIRDIVYMLRVSCHLRELTLTFSHATRIPSSVSQHPKVSLRRRINLPLLASLKFQIGLSDIPKELCHVAALLHTPSLVEVYFVDLQYRRRCYPSTNAFFKRYAFPSSLQVMRRDLGWCEPFAATCACVRPHTRSACPANNHHV